MNSSSLQEKEFSGGRGGLTKSIWKLLQNEENSVFPPLFFSRGQRPFHGSYVFQFKLWEVCGVFWLTQGIRHTSGTLPDPPRSSRGEVKKNDFDGIFRPPPISSKFNQISVFKLTFVPAPEGTQGLFEAYRTALSALNTLVHSQRVWQRVGIPPKSAKS